MRLRFSFARQQDVIVGQHSALMPDHASDKVGGRTGAHDYSHLKGRVVQGPRSKVQD